MVLLWSSFALGFVTMYLEWQREPEIYSHPLALLFIVALMGLAAWLNVAIWQGRNWARVVTLVFTILNVLLYLVPGMMPTPTIDAIIALVSTVCVVVAMVFVYTQPGTTWFQGTRDGDADA